MTNGRRRGAFIDICGKEKQRFNQVQLSMRCFPEVALSLGFDEKEILGIEMNDSLYCLILCLYFLLCCPIARYAASSL